MEEVLLVAIVALHQFITAVFMLLMMFQQHMRRGWRKNERGG
jgi:hypothetical protein